MVRSVAGSRFMSYLLISKAVKYFRDRPQEAARIIAANPYLKELQQNPHVRVAVLENPYLKKSRRCCWPAPPSLPPSPRRQNLRRRVPPRLLKIA